MSPPVLSESKGHAKGGIFSKNVGQCRFAGEAPILKRVSILENSRHSHEEGMKGMLVLAIKN
jgi:hypothetical protein